MVSHVFGSVCDRLMKSEATFFNAAAFSVTTLSILTLSLVLPGCAGPSGKSSQPKPGSGIAEYRQITREAHRSVTATVESLEALARPSMGDSKPHPELARFDRALHDLELTSVKIRARAEAIIARDEAYFDEWRGNLSATTNQSTARIIEELLIFLNQQFTAGSLDKATLARTTGTLADVMGQWEQELKRSNSRMGLF